MAVETNSLLIVADLVREQDNFCCNTGIFDLRILQKLMNLGFQLLSVRIHNLRRAGFYLTYLLIKSIQLGDQVVLQILSLSCTGLGKFLAGLTKRCFQNCP